MSIVAQTPFNEYTANGSSSTFGFEFEVKQASHLVVEVDGAVVSSGDYTVSGVGVQAGGSVVFDTAPAADSTVLIYRSVPLARTVAYTTNGPFPATTVNLDFDLIWMVLQGLNSHRDGVLRAPYPESIDEMPDAATRAGGVLYFDDDGQPAILEDLVADMEQASEDAATATTKAAEASASAAAAANSEAQAAAIVLGNFLADGASAVERTFSSKARDIVSAFDFMTTAQIADVKAFTYGEDVTTAYAAFLTAAAGKIGFTPEGGYLLGSQSLPSDTTLYIEGGSTLRKKVNGTRVFQYSNVENTHVYAAGAILDGETSADSASSHTVQFVGATNCSLRDAHVQGAGTNNLGQGRDCIYIGKGTGSCENIDIIGGSCVDALRNGISVVDAFRVNIDGVKITGTTGNPGAGIDIEANEHGKIGYIEIQRCKIYSNEDWGIVAVFGDRISIHDNRIFSNGKAAIGLGAGGTQWDLIVDGKTADVARSNIDVRAISAVDAATDKLTISGASTLSVGTVVAMAVRGAGVRPTGASTSQCLVLTNDGTDITLTADGVTTMNFTDTGSGTLTTDPTTSELFLKCYEEGQCSHIKIFRNHCYDNGGTRGELDVSGCVDAEVFDNDLDPALDNSGIFCAFARSLDIYDNRVTGKIASTSATARGIHVGICSSVSTRNNRIRDFVGVGMNISGVLLPGSFSNDRITNCGTVGTYMMKLANMDGAVIDTPVLRLDRGYTTTYGIGVDTGVTNTHVDKARCVGVGSSNANSILLTGSGNKKINCLQNDGTLVNT